MPSVKRMRILNVVHFKLKTKSDRWCVGNRSRSRDHQWQQYTFVVDWLRVTYRGKIRSMQKREKYIHQLKFDVVRVKKKKKFDASIERRPQYTAPRNVCILYYSKWNHIHILRCNIMRLIRSTASHSNHLVHQTGVSLLGSCTRQKSLNNEVKKYWIR